MFLLTPSDSAENLDALAQMVLSANCCFCLFDFGDKSGCLQSSMIAKSVFVSESCTP